MATLKDLIVNGSARFIGNILCSGDVTNGNGDKLSQKVTSDNTIKSIKYLTEAEYNAITTKDNTVLYVIH